MKWTYRNCSVEITATAQSPSTITFMPVVKIYYGTAGAHKLLATTESFPTPELAEQRGMNMARKWIDETFK